VGSIIPHIIRNNLFCFHCSGVHQFQRGEVLLHLTLVFLERKRKIVSLADIQTKKGNKMPHTLFL